MRARISTQFLEVARLDQPLGRKKKREREREREREGERVRERIREKEVRRGRDEEADVKQRGKIED